MDDIDKLQACPESYEVIKFVQWLVSNTCILIFSNLTEMYEYYWCILKRLWYFWYYFSLENSRYISELLSYISSSFYTLLLGVIKIFCRCETSFMVKLFVILNVCFITLYCFKYNNVWLLKHHCLNIGYLSFNLSKY